MHIKSRLFVPLRVLVVLGLTLSAALGVPQAATAAPVMSDTFNGPTFNSTYWDTGNLTSGMRWCATTTTDPLADTAGTWKNTTTTSCNSTTQAGPYGSTSFASGQAVFSAGTQRTFPYLVSATNMIPTTGDFVIDLWMTFTSVTGNGAQVRILDWADSTASGSNPPAGSNTVLKISGSSTAGLQVTLLDKTVTIADTTAAHHYQLVYEDGLYSIKVDAVPRIHRVPSTVRPDRVWMGNPIYTHWVNQDWTDFKVDHFAINDEVSGVAANSLDDTFSGTSLDAAVWDSTYATAGLRWCANSSTNALFTAGNWRDPATTACQGATQSAAYGSVAVASGAAAFSAGVQRGFPWIRPVVSPFPTAENFAIDFEAEFTELTTNGSGVLISQWANPNVTATSTDIPGQGKVLWLRGSTAGLEADLAGTVYTIANGTTPHLYRLEYIGNGYYLYVDHILKNVYPATVGDLSPPTSLWIGNPAFVWWTSSNWSDFKLKHLTVTDTSAPLTFINTMPATSTTATSATFTFTSGEPGSTFECAIDDGPSWTTWTSCVSGVTYAGLGVGAHEFRVRSIDAAGLTGGADPYSWTITP